ncbi:MAG: hypothetical protein GW769_00125 [Alphaproteobacteria bacterium]|nr:hypothetical protein [Alphaproteobacteria bacterium]
MYMRQRANKLELPGNHKFLMLACILISALGYVADGYKQKSTNACLKRIEGNKKIAMSNFDRASKTNNVIDRKLAAQYAGYLSQNSDKVCDGL